MIRRSGHWLSISTRNWIRTCGKVLSIMTRIFGITCLRFCSRRIFTNWGFWMTCTGRWEIIVTKKGSCYWVTPPGYLTCWLPGMILLSCSRKQGISTSISWLTSFKTPRPCNGETSCHLSWTRFQREEGLWSWGTWNKASIDGVTGTGVCWRKG